MATGGYEDVGSKQRGKSAGTASQGVPYWGDYPEAYDTVVLAGYPLPGLCTIKGKGYEMRRSHAKPPGKHGASITYIANEPAEFVIHVMMTTEDHLRAFERLVPLFKPSAKPSSSSDKSKTDSFTFAFTGQASKSADGTIILPVLNVALRDRSQPGFLSVTHPMLALFRISHCRVIRVTIPEQKEDKGMWQAEIHCLEQVLDGSRKAKTGKTGDAGLIAPRKTAYDSTLALAEGPSTTNAGPPK